ncbi:MFS transporter [Actinomadura sp. 6K520]|uniref:MFS transporter n=1 Tax=Actinomadura sp. 6K520 TaxID=2530364 RepID=UPI0010498872|nr:MFS transporter [Actinomadura sp. 6K520]TDE29979.1 MFS transporter [Actinomadura sp. 6K520]
MFRSLSPLSPLKDPEIAPLFIARLVSSAGAGFGQLALAWGVMQLGYGPGGLAIVLACNSVPALLIIVTGVAGDRFQRHRVLITAELATSLAWLAFAVCFWTEKATLPLLCALATLSGIGTAMFLPTIRGIVADLLAENGRRAGNALIKQTDSIGLLIGLSSSGMVVSTVGPGWAASTRGVLCAVGALVLCRLRTPSWRSANPNFLRELRAGWREFTSHRWVWIMTLQYTAVIVAMICYTDIAGPIYMDDGHGGARAWGIVTACEYVGALAGALLGSRWKPARPVLIAAALPAAGAVPMFLMGIQAPWAVLAAATLIPGVGAALYYVLWTTALQNTFAPEVLVRVNSWNIIASYVLMPVTVLTAGPLVQGIGAEATVLAAAALTTVAVACSLLILRSTPAALAVTRKTIGKGPDAYVIGQAAQLQSASARRSGADSRQASVTSSATSSGSTVASLTSTQARRPLAQDGE